MTCGWLGIPCRAVTFPERCGRTVRFVGNTASGHADSLDRLRGIRVRARTARWVAGCAGAGSVALMGGGLALAYVDRQLVPASLTNWTVSGVSGQVVNMAVPVTGFVPRIQAAGEPDWLAVPGGGAGAGPEWFFKLVRAARTGRGTGVFARRPGVCLAVGLWVGDRGRHARLLVLDVSDRGAALPAVAPGCVVCGHRICAGHAMYADRRQQRVGCPFALSGPASPGGLTALFFTVATLLISAVLTRPWLPSRLA